MSETMKAARLHGPKDLRIDSIPRPSKPGRAEVIIKVKAAGICGSDLHNFVKGRIGDAVIREPITLGHEFSGEVYECGPEALDGEFQKLKPGMRVAVDPAQPCNACEMCEQGHPNLCLNLHFLGLYPDNGCYTEYIRMPSRCCFPLPPALSQDQGVMLEPLGIAMHTVNLAHTRVNDDVVILGAGPIGLLTLQLCRLAGTRVIIADRYDWRLKAAEKLGGIPVNITEKDLLKKIMELTAGRGADIAIEAAWCDESVQQCAEILRNGGRIVLVGIPEDDSVAIKPSVWRRKGLTLRMCRRMKHTYPKAIALTLEKKVDLDSLITHHVNIDGLKEAFEMNTAYQNGVIKVILTF